MHADIPAETFRQWQSTLNRYLLGRKHTKKIRNTSTYSAKNFFYRRRQDGGLQIPFFDWTTEATTFNSFSSLHPMCRQSYLRNGQLLRRNFCNLSSLLLNHTSRENIHHCTTSTWKNGTMVNHILLLETCVGNVASDGLEQYKFRFGCFSTYRVPHGTTYVVVLLRPRYCITQLLLVIRIRKIPATISIWHDGQATSDVSDSFSTALSILILVDFIKNWETWPTKDEFVYQYYNDEELNTSDMAQEKVLSRLYNRVAQILQRIHPTIEFRSNSSHLEDRLCESTKQLGKAFCHIYSKLPPLTNSLRRNQEPSKDAALVITYESWTPLYPYGVIV